MVTSRFGRRNKQVPDGDQRGNCRVGAFWCDLLSSATEVSRCTSGRLVAEKCCGREGLIRKVG